MKSVTLLLALLIITTCIILQCSNNSIDNEPFENPNQYSPSDITAVDKSLATADNVFGIKLFKQTFSDSPDENVIISPLSVAMALTMTYNGADGETRTAMQNALELQGMTLEEVNQSYRNLIDVLTGIDPAITFNIANSIWYRLGLQVKSTFLDLNTTYFDADVSALDFGADGSAQIINDWVDEKTNGKISRIITGAIPADVIMYLINAIYFKGDWSDKFDSDLTQSVMFNIDHENQVECEMMLKETSFDYYRGPEFQAVQLPYGDSAFNMMVVLPDEESNVDHFIEQFDYDLWKSMRMGLSETDAMVGLPKFTLEYETSLVNALTSLGMGHAFSGSADFSGIADNIFLAISDVRHKTFIEVNEEGTEAAAVTSVVVTTSIGDDPTIYCDRPFLIFIYEKHSGAIIFSGKIMDPTGGS